MIELLVAVAISSFIILGITQVFIDNQRNYIYQKNQSSNQSGSRFSLLMLEQEINKAGYRRLPQDTKELIFPTVGAAGGCPAFNSGQFIRPTANGLGVCYRYQRAINTDRDCQGSLIPNGNVITVRLEFQPATGQLVCSVNGNAQTTLITGINQATFLYGVDTNDDRVADAYLTQPLVPVTASILAVRYALLHQSESNGVALASNSYNFPLSNATPTTPADKRLYKSAQGTSTVRNIAQ